MGVQYIYPSQTPRHDAAFSFAATADGNDGEALSFKDIVDAVNPLQQLPVVGDIYRHVTGDTLSTFSRLAGGALLGGPVGFALAAAGSVFEAATGGDVGEHLLALLDGGGQEVQLAQANRFYLKADRLEG